MSKEAVAQPDELQQDMAQLIAQAQSAGLPTPSAPADSSLAQVQDQASLDAAAAQ